MSNKKSDFAIESELSSKKYITNILIRFLTNGLLQLRSLIFLPLIAKNLGSSNYGIWTQLIATVHLFTPILMLRLETSCVRYLGAVKDKDELKKTFFSMVFFILLFSSLIVAIILSFPSLFSYIVFGNNYFINYSILLGLMILINVMQVFLFNYFRIFNKFKILSTLQIFQRFSEILLIIVFVIIFEWGLIGAILGYLIIQIFFTILIFVYLIFKFGFSIDIQIIKRLKPYLSYSIPLIPAGISYWIINASDRYVIAHFLNLSELGIYAASYGLATLIIFFVTPISYVLFPTISKLWEKKQIYKTKSFIAESVKYYLTLAIPSSLGLYHLAPFILKFLATDEFVTSNLILILLIMSFVLFGIYQMMYYIVDLTEKTKYMPFIFIPIALFNLSFNFILIPSFGILGAAISTFLSFLILTIIIFYLSRKWLPVNINTKLLIKTIFNSLLMYLAISFYLPKSIFDVIIIIFIGLIIYFSLMFLTMAFGKKEIRLITSILKK